MHRYDGAVGQEGFEHLEIRLRALVGVIAIDPEKAELIIPIAREIVRVCALDLDPIENTGGPQVGDEVIVRSTLTAAPQIGICARRRSMGIDRDHFPQSQLPRDVGDSNRRSTLEAADLEVLPMRGRQRRGRHHQTSFALREVAGRRRDAAPAGVNDFFDALEILVGGLQVPCLASRIRTRVETPLQNRRGWCDPWSESANRMTVRARGGAFARAAGRDTQASIAAAWS